MSNKDQQQHFENDNGFGLDKEDTLSFTIPKRQQLHSLAPSSSSSVSANTQIQKFLGANTAISGSALSRSLNASRAGSHELLIPSSGGGTAPVIQSKLQLSLLKKETSASRDILKFPIESSHAYSYAKLSQNSLSFRLGVLKRSLEILKDRPKLLKSINESKHYVQQPLQSASESIDGPYTGSATAASDDEMKVDVEEEEGGEFLSMRAPHTAVRRPGISRSTSNTNDYKSLQYKKLSLGFYTGGTQTPVPALASTKHNASSAALAAFFNPKVKRSGSLPIDEVYSMKYNFQNKTPINDGVLIKPRDTSSSSSKERELPLNDELREILKLLESNSDAIIGNTEVASNLHDLSLSTNEADHFQLKYDFLKNKLLYALATPFIENGNGGAESIGVPMINDGQMQIHQSSLALNMLAQPHTQQQQQQQQQQQAFNSARPFHTLYSGKHTLPESIFTVEVDFPWSVKAANDVACLMFGVLKKVIPSLTLMDLIAPQFRVFVMDRLNKRTAELLDRGLKNYSVDKSPVNDIIFAGEIVAIVRPGEKDYAWTSMWAKRKGKLIICMFDQIPCNAFDVTILRGKNEDQPCYVIDSITEIAGKLLKNSQNYKLLSDISDSLASEINKKLEDNIDSEEEQSTIDSNLITKTRYYTVNFDQDDYYIPCAITSVPLLINEDRVQLKLKIHSLPYIAGMFVINAYDNTILSCNNAIAKNLFGKSANKLVEQSIDTLIPNFSKVLTLGLSDNLEFPVVPGLVLPEHFFRKYDAILRAQQDGINDAEAYFFQSHGLEGIHRDGKSIFVDVQLRAGSRDTFVLWITYSILKKRVANELHRLNSSASSLSLSQKTSTTSLSKDREKDLQLPSQMKLLDEEKAEIPEATISAPSSSEISRKSSTRRLSKKPLITPLTKVNIALETAISNDETLKQRVVSNKTDDSILSTNKSETDSSPPSSSDEIGSKKGNETDGKPSAEVPPSRSLVINFNYQLSEADMLRLENESLEEIKKKSSQWPTEVGAKRRTKKFLEFEVVKSLGEGAYGKVVQTQHKEDPAYKIIIKCITKERILVDTWVRDRKLGTIPSEIQIMATLNHEPHPNIMRIVDYFEDRNYYYLETPIFGNPPAIDLFDYIEIKKDMTETECRFIFRQVVLAIYHLHTHGIVHRDIKDENVIVDENGIIKLIDFGSAAYTKSGPFDVFVGTIHYASPEVLRGEKYEGKPQDIWALGVLLYTLLFKENPFYNVDDIMEGDLRISGLYSDNCIGLVRMILVRTIEERPSITDIAEHQWLSS
ncbi:uncharacterized protein KQ657_001253 [Scheffersomyces spartinae]|uniref:non-specific serine/threonine protein kinase n=1 Tax=Scheffersomyces spartinae TaxID=45513 RepID=A0A9P7V822_9ASCO|nr:uncharacterized protein KQ657_001253 [Scheffersomyces spartinae]KAG7192798.1 hypothetical protein KQ657_001253 [Scheffersomyces spartinae]